MMPLIPVRYFALTLMLSPFYCDAQRWEFDASQLGLSDASLAVFNQGGQLPGSYRVDVLLNGEIVDTRNILFRKMAGKSENVGLVPCLSIGLLNQYGIRVEDYPRLAPSSSDTSQCSHLNAVPDVEATFSFSSQQLLLTVPQAVMRQVSGELAPREQWNDGIDALLLNYQASMLHTSYRGSYRQRMDSPFILLEPGLNIGPWRLRHSTSWQKNTGQGSRWETAYTFAERGLYGMKSRLTLGARFTPYEVFDSVPFRGVMLGTDDEMVPFSERRFSPVVSGVVRSLARVLVRQQGYTLYDSTVAPGPFRLDNLRPVSGGGDLDVTVEESSGLAQHFIVSWQTPSIAVHSGYLKYNLMAGQYNPAGRFSGRTGIAQVSAIYGLPLGATIYGGLQGAERFHALSLGVGVSLGSAGSFSLDTTHDRVRSKNASQGKQWRVRYSKSVDATHSSLALTWAWSPSGGYRTLSDALERRSVPRGGMISRAQLSFNQSLGALGYLSLSTRRTRYRQSEENDRSESIRYNTRLKDLSLSLDWTRSRWQGKVDRLLSIMFSIPLGNMPGAETMASGQMLSPTAGKETWMTGLSGQGMGHRLNWNVMQRFLPGNAGTRSQSHYTSSLGWRGSQGIMTANYSHSPQVTGLGASLSGSGVLTPGGWALGQPLNGTAALVGAPGAAEIPVGGWPGVKTDGRGYTVLSGLQPYQRNVISLDPARLPHEAEITRTDIPVVPTNGAIIPAVFATHIGKKALLGLTDSSGQAIPFGSVVTPEAQNNAGNGIVGENGKVYLSGLSGKGYLQIRWGLSARQSCRAAYHLPKVSGPAGIFSAWAKCL